MSTTRQLAPTAGWQIHLLELCVVDMPPAMVAPEGELDPPILEAINILLLRRPEQTLLLDAGPGLLASWMPGLAVDLDASLAAAGCARTDIDLVVLTHLHFDHVGGLVEGEWPDHLRPAFPQAMVVVLADAAASARTTPRDAFMNAGTPVIEVLENAGRLREVTDGSQIAPALRIRATPGHAPGHATIEIGGEQPLVFLGDVLHHPIHARHPEWAGASDTDPDEALDTRLTMLTELAKRKVRVVAPHLMEPSLGYFKPKETAYRWATLD